MTVDRAEKIAATLVRQFSREKYFSISLPSHDDLEMLASILRERFRCTVVWNLPRNKISVYCPEGELHDKRIPLEKELVPLA